MLTRSWFTNIVLKSKNNVIFTNKKSYLKGVFQGNSLPILLFILALNPLLFLWNGCKGYPIRSEICAVNISHLFFVNDLKLFVLNTI